MSGLIPRPFIDELINRTDIIEYIDSYVPLKKRGNSYLACCPFHNEKTPSFNVVAKKQFYHCFGCGESGNAISFAMNYLNLGFVEAVESLAARLGMQVPRDHNAAKEKPAANLYDLLKNVSSYYEQALKTQGQKAIDYLKNRKVSGEVAKLYQLGYAPSGWHNLESQYRPYKKDLITTGMLIEKEDGNTYDRYRNRITFPIHDRHGRIIGFGGRALEADQNPKYLNSPETVLFQKNRELYGLHQIIQSKEPFDSIIVVEGYMDVIALAQHGIKNAVATLGTATSSFHIQLLSKHTKKILFCFDGDKAGRQAAWRALESSLSSLNSGLDAYFMFLEEGHDPDSLVRQKGRDFFLQAMEKATSLPLFFYSTLSEKIDTNSMAGKSQLVQSAKPHLTKMGDGPYRQLLIDDLARLTRIEPHRVLQLISSENKEPVIEKEGSISRTPLRVALAIIVQNPELGADFQSVIQNLEGEDHIDTLQKIISLIKEYPNLSTASLVEFWRETPLFHALRKLATWDHQVPENTLKNELSEIISFLVKQQQEKKITILLEKARKEGLTEMDRHALQELLKKKHLKATGENLNME